MKHALILIALLLAVPLMAQTPPKLADPAAFAVNLKWDPPAQGEVVTGYKVYHGYSPRKYDGVGSPATIDASKQEYSFLSLGQTGTVYFAVKAVNGAQESDYSNEVAVTVIQGWPRIEHPAVSYLTTTTATIAWVTTPECSGKVEYGTTASLGQTVAANNLVTTDHWAKLSNLLTRTHYSYRVVSVCGAATVTSAIRSFNTK
jgi:hypothetical protein